MGDNAEIQIIFPERVNQAVWQVGSVKDLLNNQTVFGTKEAFSGVILILFALLQRQQGY